MKRSNKFCYTTLLSIINSMNKLETWNLADTGFDSLLPMEHSYIRFENLSNLTNLDISNSSGDNDLIRLLLINSSSLKCLNLSYCYKITDDLFTNLKITCQLKELNLNFLRQVSFFFSFFFNL